MADENELKELCARIACLSGRDQTRLLEMVLAANRRQYEGLLAQALAADAAFREAEKRRQADQVVPFPPGANREAG